MKYFVLFSFLAVGFLGAQPKPGSDTGDSSQGSSNGDTGSEQAAAAAFRTPDFLTPTHTPRVATSESWRTKWARAKEKLWSLVRGVGNFRRAGVPALFMQESHWLRLMLARWWLVLMKHC